VYLYLDKLSNTFADWGQSGNGDQERPASEQGSVKQAAE